jgi:hypothetical protein
MVSNRGKTDVMRLYPKKLRSLEELKREKQVLKYARAQTRKESFLDIKADSLPGAGKKGDILSLIGDLFTSKSFADIALSVGLPMLKFAGRKTEKNIIKKLAGELIGGYVKWKLLQMGLRGIRLFMKMQQTKKEKHKQEKQEEKARAAYKNKAKAV